MKAMAWVLVLIVVGGLVFYCYTNPDRLPNGIGLRKLPIEAAVRPSLLGKGDVIILHNPTAFDICNVEVEVDGVSGKYRIPRIKAGDSVEVGWWQWRSFKTGDHITVTANGYLPGMWYIRP